MKRHIVIVTLVAVLGLALVGPAGAQAGTPTSAPGSVLGFGRELGLLVLGFGWDAVRIVLPDAWPAKHEDIDQLLHTDSGGAATAPQETPSR